MVMTLISASAGDIMPEGAVELAASGIDWDDLPEHAQQWATEHGYGESEHELLYVIPNHEVELDGWPTLII
ncbi:hypothetical protein [Nonomuraea wenchangensis]|uniref:Uncharacterized protein n=1 Tax=Nonomuraea wenchangensis TaxID=568860 RepID=A0A1I0LVC2_9ACTN|nr:hypothetical protein [Nonomuraea wenchangensis]SEU46662.1 hypothetical protein SAMN05421811_127111 [Nonomuraea wenchangensis]